MIRIRLGQRRAKCVRLRTKVALAVDLTLRENLFELVDDEHNTLGPG
jgi:hypothetical protein